ncbi:MAG: glycosyltransferase family 2 protein [Ruminococcaceae bacterium]|nr:glycosyltransferase family 2 protein [Oscillospiraceae bacterium]
MITPDYPLIAILLSTYNGSKYLEQQINSILHQKYKNWILYVRDDGSTDQTMDIIRNFSSVHNNIIFIKDNTKHRGVTDSFMYLLKHASAEYYMFCDQDDYWLPNKIDTTLNYIKTEYSNVPQLVATDLSLADKFLQIKHNSMWRECNMMYKIHNLKLLEVCDYLTGCTMLFNDSAKRVILSTYSLIGTEFLHDQIATISVLSNLGRITTIDQPTILYRQHDNNVIGGRKINNRILYRIHNFRKIIIRERKRYRLAHKVFRTNFFRFCQLRIESIFRYE